MAADTPAPLVHRPLDVRHLRRVASVAEFAAWLAAPAGEPWALYYAGELAAARADRSNRELDRLAAVVWDAARAGLVVLAQHRVDAAHFLYLACRLRLPRRSRRHGARRRPAAAVAAAATPATAEAAA